MNIRPSGIARTHYRLCMLLMAAILPHVLFAKTQHETSAPFALSENKGQVTDQHHKLRNDIDFQVSTPGISIFVGDGQLHYQWLKVKETKKEQPALLKDVLSKPTEVTYEGYRMDVTLEGANTNTVVVKENRLDYVATYYGQHTNGATVYSYQKVTYRNIYPNIDWVIYTSKDGLKYDFVVHAGGDPGQIRMRYSGASSLGLKDGEVLATTPMGTITENKPYAYNAKTKEQIAAAFVLQGNTVSFNLAPSSQDIVIDPLLNWATYYGGTWDDGINSSATNTSGDLLVAGFTYGGSNLVTTGAHQTTVTGDADGFLAKFNSSGVRQWATFYGGDRQDAFYDICVDKNGNIIATGHTSSLTGIATTGSHKSSIYDQYKQDAMLVKFNGSGVRQWGTYYGNNSSGSAWGEYTRGYSIACDTSGNIYMAGLTTAPAGIATSGAFMTSIGSSSGQTAYIAKFDTGGVRQWGTYFGNSDYDSGVDILVSKQGNVYLTGTAGSDNNIGTTGTFQPAIAGGSDAFLAKFNSSGQRQWGTFFGDNGSDYGTALTCDSLENIYICGFTSKQSGLATMGAFKTQISQGSSWNYNYDAFVASFTASGARNWSSYFGGTGDDVATDISFIPPNGIYLTGNTKSQYDPSTEYNIWIGYSTPSSINGLVDGYLTKFTSTGDQVAWSTYFGGTSEDYPVSIAHAGGQVYLSGSTSSLSQISTSTAHQASSNGYDEGFIAAFSDCIARTNSNSITGPTNLCRGVTYTFTTDTVPGATDYVWYYYPSQVINIRTMLDTAKISFEIGNTRIFVKAMNNCGETALTPINLTTTEFYHDRISVIGDTLFCEFDSVLLQADPATITYQWLLNDSVINGQATNNFYAKSSGNYHFIVTDVNGCADTSRKVPVVVFPAPQPVVTLSNMFDLSTGLFSTYQWFKDGAAIPNATAIAYTASANGSYTVFVEDNKGCGNMSAPITISNVGVADIARGTLAIYPNPVVDVVTIRGVSAGSYTVVNVLGAQVRAGILNSEQLDLSSLTAGNYVLNIVTPEGKTATAKFVKQ